MGATPKKEATSVASKTSSAPAIGALRLPKVPAATAEAEADEQRFEARSREILAKLPRKKALRQMTPEEVHGMPAPLFAAGAALGEIAEALESKPHLRPQGARFYAECSARKDMPSSVRATCYSNLIKLTRELRDGRYLMEVAESVEQPIVDLAKNLEG
jgi:hypothetical protein